MREDELDLFRNTAKDVAVVTFDELLEKLRAIHALMSRSSTPPAGLAEIEESRLEANTESDNDEGI